MRLDRFVAMKFLPRSIDSQEEEKQRFIIEAKAASSLDHPNICTIHEIDETIDGQMFIVMGYYEGETLKEKIDRGPMRGAEVLAVTRQVAQGLAKAAKEGIVHRDIKPANIMVTTDGVVKILDFGLARLSGHTKISAPGSRLGTAAYMSPEQIMGEELDHRSEVVLILARAWSGLPREPRSRGLVSFRPILLGPVHKPLLTWRKRVNWNVVVPPGGGAAMHIGIRAW